jgi:hypothetical protein
MTVYVVSFKDKIPSNAITVNTTSRSDNWSRELSPFLLGPVQLYAGLEAKCHENAWQFSKVYDCHVDCNGDPSQDYWFWATKGWQDTYAHRYPMGKGKKPLYSYWNKEKLSYIEARKKIYIPLYSSAVVKTNAFSKLEELFLQDKDLYLQDFDGYNHKKLEMSYHDVLHCESRKMGHAFVLAMILDQYLKDEEYVG